MACLFERNKKKEITNGYLLNGKESELIPNILSFPLMNDEVAVNKYAELYVSEELRRANPNIIDNFRAEDKNMGTYKPVLRKKKREGMFSKISENQFNTLLDTLSNAIPSARINLVSGKTINDILSEGSMPLSTNSGQIYGFVKDGDFYFNTDISFNANTPIHEFGHLWMLALKSENPTLYKKIINTIKADKELMDSVRNNPNYKHLTTEEAIANEVLATEIGNIGEYKYNKQPKNQGLYSLILKFWDWLKGYLGANNDIKNWSDNDWQNATLQDISEFVADELLAGKPISRVKEELNSKPTYQRVFDNNAEVKEIISNAKQNGTYLKAPNGKETNLSEEQWALVRTKAFIDWFGDWINNPEEASKVVDENGEPLVVYHGTNNFGFTEFNKEYSDDGSSIFFTKSIDIAKGYAGVNAGIRSLSNEEETTYTKDEILDLLFKDVDISSHTDGYDVANEILAYLQHDIGITAEYGEDDGITDEEDIGVLTLRSSYSGDVYRLTKEEFTWEKVLDWLKYNADLEGVIDHDAGIYGVFVNSRKVMNVDAGGAIWNFIPKKKVEGAGDIGSMSTREIVKHAKNLGYEGVYIKDLNDAGNRGYGLVGDVQGDIFISLVDGNQIKSATDNVGSFSNESNDIRYQIAGQQGFLNAKNKEALKQLKEAKKMLSNGLSMQQIEEKTGWYKEEDGWKREVGYGNLKIDLFDTKLGIKSKDEFGNEIRVFKLQDIYQNEDIFEMYPEFKEVEVRVYDKPILVSDVVSVEMQVTSNGISVFTNNLDDSFKLFNITEENEKQRYTNATIQHEIQHLIQFAEGFEVGGNTEQFDLYLGLYLDSVVQGDIAPQEIFRVSDKEFTIKDIVEKSVNNVEEFYRNLKEQSDVDSLNNDIERIKYNLYILLAGEQEAELVFDRSYLSDKERSAEKITDTSYYKSIKIYENGEGEYNRNADKKRNRKETAESIADKVRSQKERKKQEILDYYRKDRRGVGVSERGFNKSNVDFQIVGQQGFNNSGNSSVLNDLEYAKELRRQGVANNEIEKRTKWFLDNGSWKREIGYGEVKLDILDKSLGEKVEVVGEEARRLSLKDIYDNQELYELYPELKNRSVYVIDNVKNKKLNDFSFFVQNGEFFINVEETIKDYGEVEYRNGRRVVLFNSGITKGVYHEVQHLIQAIEGFERGGSPKQFIEEAKYLIDRLAVGDTQPTLLYSDEYGKRLTLVDILKDLGFDGVLHRINEVPNNKQVYNALIREVSKYLYNHLAGEVEANMVMNRWSRANENIENEPITETDEFNGTRFFRRVQNSNNEIFGEELEHNRNNAEFGGGITSDAELRGGNENIFRIEESQGRVYVRNSRRNSEELNPTQSLETEVIYANGEPKLFYKSAEGNYFKTYKEALKDSSKGSIEVGFLLTENIGKGKDVEFDKNNVKVNNPNIFVKSFSVSVAKNYGHKSSFINLAIEKDYISDKKVLNSKGEWVYKINGDNKSEISHNRNRFKREITNYGLLGKVKIRKNNTVEIAEFGDSVSVFDEQGNVKQVDFELFKREISEVKDIKKLQDKYPALTENYISLLMKNVDTPQFVDEVSLEDNNYTTDNLRKSMFRILEQFGFKTMALSNYMDRFSLKHGQIVTPNALIDIANKIVALSENASIQDLTEEVAHLFIESYANQEEIDRILPFVEGTAMWQRYAKQYTEIYKNTYSGKELQNAVRREILGKLLSEAVNKNFDRQNIKETKIGNSVLDFLSDLWDKIISFVKGYYVGANKEDLSEIVDLLSKQMISDNFMEYMNDNNLNNNRSVYYSTKDMANLIQLDRIIKTLTDKLSREQRGKSVLQYTTQQGIGYLSQLNRNNLTELEAFNAVKSFLSTLNADVKYYTTLLESQKLNLNDQFNSIDAEVRELGSDVLDLVLSVSEVVEKDFKSNIVVKQNGITSTLLKTDLLQDIDTTILGINKMNGLYRSVAIAKAKKLAESDTENILSRQVNANFEGTVINEQPLLDKLYDFLQTKGVNANFLSWKDFIESNVGQKYGIEFLQDKENYQLYRSYIQSKKSFDYTEKLENSKRDTNILIKNFGFLKSSNNWFLRKLYDTILKMNTNLSVRTQEILNPFIFSIKKSFGRIPTIEDNRLLREKRKDDSYSDFIVSAIDNSFFDENRERIYVETFNEILGTKYKKFSDLDSDLKKGKITNIADNIDKDNAKLQSLLDKYEESLSGTTTGSLSIAMEMASVRFNDFKKNHFNDKKYKPEFYEKVKRINERLGISNETLSALGNISQLRRIANSGEGRVSKQDVHEARKVLSSFYSGQQLKTGIDLRIAEEIKRKDAFFALTIREYQSEFHKQQALDEFNKKHFYSSRDYIDIDFLNENIKTFGTKSAFFDEYSNIPNSQKSEWIDNNVSFRINSNFWEAQDISFIEKLRTAIVPEDQQEAFEQELEYLEDLLSKRRDLLSTFQKYNNPAEISYSSVEAKGALSDIKHLDNEIKKVTSRFKFQGEEAQQETIGEITPTQDYYSELEKSGLTEIEFLKKHIPNPALLDNMADFMAGKNVRLSGSAKFFLKRLAKTQDVESMRPEEKVLEFGYSMLYSYFKKYAPQGYDQYVNIVKSGRYSMQDIIDKNMGLAIEKYVDVVPDYKWQEDTNQKDLLNPNYYEDLDGNAYVMPNEINKQFLETFGIDEHKFRKLGVLEPPTIESIENETDNAKKITKRKLRADYMALITKNKEHFELREQYLLMMDKSKELTGQDSHNRYQIPQVSKRGIQRVQDLAENRSIESLDRYFKDMFQVRRDTLEYGSELNRGGVKYVPLMYFSKLEEREDVSEDFLESYAVMLHEAIKFDERKKALAEVGALRVALLAQGTFEDGKKIEGSNVLSKFDEAVDAYIYGVKYNRTWKVKVGNTEVDLGNLLSRFNKYIGSTNSKYNTFFSTTGMMTGRTLRLIENITQEFVDSKTMIDGNRIAIENMIEYASEAGKVDKKSDAYLLRELLGLKHTRDRVQSSAYARGLRSTDNIAYKIYEITGYMVDDPSMYQILLDTKIHNGKAITKREFMRKYVGYQGKTKEQLTKEWEAMPSLYAGRNNPNNILKMNKETGVVEFDANLSEEQKREIIKHVTGRVRNLISNINGQLDISDVPPASRDFALEYFMTHKAWFFLNLDKRFKGRVYNNATNEFEEGTYTTLWNFSGRIFKAYANFYKHKDFSRFRNQILMDWKSLSEEERKNIIRAYSELAIMLITSALAVFVMGAMNDDDDEDENWALQFLGYNYIRMTSEIGSIQMPTGLLDTLNILQEPTIAVNNIKEISSLLYSNPLKEVGGNSPYAGHTKLYKTLVNQTILKQYYNNQNLNSKANYFSKKNEGSLYVFHMLQDMFKEE